MSDSGVYVRIGEDHHHHREAPEISVSAPICFDKADRREWGWLREKMTHDASTGFP